MKFLQDTFSFQSPTPSSPYQWVKCFYWFPFSLFLVWENRLLLQVACQDYHSDGGGGRGRWNLGWRPHNVTHLTTSRRVLTGVKMEAFFRLSISHYPYQIFTFLPCHFFPFFCIFRRGGGKDKIQIHPQRLLVWRMVLDRIALGINGMRGE